ncbi:hypothetical protein ACLD9W_08055 [Neisseria sp. WLZKY-1]|uniref:hypothetical protein n=1 Tax=Neisseria sp. WLZKY-1 TaxID=3390377 RepID=UPI00397AF1C5
MSQQTDVSLNTLISASGTIAGMGLALVGILAAKQSLKPSEMISDDLFLFSSIGFLLVVVGYTAQKNSSHPYVARLVTLAEWIFSLSLLTVVAAAFILLYAEV